MKTKNNKLKKNRLGDPIFFQLVTCSEKEIDVDLLNSNLELTPEQRLLQHHGAYKLLIELEKARREHSA